MLETKSTNSYNVDSHALNSELQPKNNNPKITTQKMKKQATDLSYLHSMRKETTSYIKAVLRKLQNIRQIDDADYGMIHLLATNYNMFMIASEQLGDDLIVINSKGDRVRNPLIDIKQKAENACVTICRELLATPKSRKTLKENDDDDETSPLENFLKTSF